MKSSPKNAFAFLFFFTLILTVTGCAEALVEKSTETVLENSMEGELGDVDVDLSTGNVQITTDAIVYGGGENSSWPDTIPDDVYKIDGTVVSSMTDLETNSYWVMVQTSLTAQEANDLYKSELESEGWTTVATANYSGTTSLSLEKDDRLLTVMTVTSEGITSVTITEARE